MQISTAKRIALIVSSMEGGGAERVASILCNRWIAAGHNVTLIPTFSGRGTCSYALDERVEVKFLADVAEGRSKRLGNKVRRFLALRRCIREAHPDVVVSFLTRVNVVSILATLGMDTKLVVSERNNPAQDPVGGSMKVLRTLVYGFADVVVAQTQYAAKWLSKHCIRANVTTIPNPVEVPIPVKEPVLPPGDWIDEERCLLLAAGRLTPQKNFGCLMEAFALVADRCLEWDLVVIGEGVLRKELEERVERYGLSGRIRFPGRVGNVADWYQRADLYVLSSLYEGFPNTLLEALANGVPAVSFDCEAGPREIIRDGVNGLLVPMVGGARSLADALETLMQDKERRRAIGNAAMQVRNEYSFESIENKWSQVIEAGSL